MDCAFLPFKCWVLYSINKQLQKIVKSRDAPIWSLWSILGSLQLKLSLSKSYPFFTALLHCNVLCFFTALISYSTVFLNFFVFCPSHPPSVADIVLYNSLQSRISLINEWKLVCVFVRIGASDPEFWDPDLAKSRGEMSVSVKLMFHLNLCWCVFAAACVVQMSTTLNSSWQEFSPRNWTTTHILYSNDSSGQNASYKTITAAIAW